MSQDIICNKYHDPKIKSIIQDTKQLNDKFPVLLMPLRLETRYMTVDRPVENAVKFDYKILYDLIKLEYYAERLVPVHEMELGDANALVQSFNSATDTLGQRFKNPKSLPYPENTWWSKHLGAVNVAKSQFVSNFNKINFSNDVERQMYDSMKDGYMLALDIVLGFEVKTVKNTDFDETSRLIDQLNNLDEVMEDLSRKSMTYNTQNKEVLFNYIDGRIDHMLDLAGNIEEGMNKNLLANTTQINRIDDFPGIYSSRLVQIQNNFNKINSEYKRAEFTNRLQNEVKPRMDELGDDLKDHLVPKLNYTKKLKTVFAQELLYRAYVLNYELEMLLQKGIYSYQQLRTERVKLYALLRKFRASGHDIIIGSQYDIDQLRTWWGKVDTLLNKYINLVSTIQGSNSREEAGITRAMSHINENYRIDLNGLKKSVPITEPYIKNSDFMESAKSYRILMEKLQDIVSYVYSVAHKQSITKDDLNAAYNEVVDFEGECSVLTIKTTIIPEEYYKNIHSSYGGFKQSIAQINTKVQGNASLSQPMAAINDCVELIDASINNLSSDITDEKDPFYDDFRKKFIFSLTTETKEELWVRIYPDEVFTHSHEKAITQEEHDDTKIFWTEVWNGGGNKEIEISAWRVLALKYGVNRAMYLRQLLDPQKAQQSGPGPNRPALAVKEKLEGTKERFSKILELDIKSADAANEISWINSDLNDALNIQVQFYEEHTIIIKEIVEEILQVQLQINSVNTMVSEVPESEKSSITGFLSTLENLVDRVNNLSDAISEKVARDNTADLNFWVVPNIPGTGVEFKETTWSEAPMSNTLPNRFVFLGMQNNAFSHMVVGNEVPDPLIMGIDPSNMDSDAFEHDSSGNLKVDEKIKWMTDFDEAVKKGMGIIVPLTKESRAVKFEKIMVLGIKPTSPGNAKDLLSSLIEGHIYSPDGLSLLPIGTPTNITEKKTSGFSSEEDEDKAYDRITGAPLFSMQQNEKDITDGQRLIESLGLSETLFERIENTERKDIYKALFMNKAMWASTMGNYLEEIMDTTFTLDNFNRTRDYFCKYVSGRGILPAIRIGSQPYGILPTTAFSRLKYDANDTLEPLDGTDFKTLSESQLEIKLQKRFDKRLKDLLNSIREQWMVIVGDENLNVSQFDPTITTSQDHFMQLLGLQPTSIEQYIRYNVNSAQRRMSHPSQDKEITVNFKDSDLFGYKNLDLLFGDFVKKGYFIDDTYFEMNHINRIEEARIFRLRYLDTFIQLSGPFVREGDEEFLKTVQGHTYIDKLLFYPPYDLWQDMYGEVESNSIFFLFLRQSLAAAYRNAAFDILMEEGIINENTRRRAGTKGTYLLPSGTNGDVALTKWDYLFREPAFFEDMMTVSPFAKFPLAQNPVDNSFWDYLKNRKWSMSKYLFEVTRTNASQQVFSNTHNIAHLNELRQMYLEMEGMPIGELERMFAEHLDLCTYRFDAWQLGVANKRLHDLRSAPGGEDGIHLGAFGWLEDLEPGGERKVSTEVPPALREYDGVNVYTDEDNEGFIHAPSINHAMTAAILRSGYIANKGAGDQSNPMAVNLTSRRVRMALNLLEGMKNGQDVAALLGYQFERGLHEGYTENGLELDTYIYTLRRKFPLVVEVDVENAPDPDEDRNLLNVINGSTVLDEVRKFLGSQLNSDSSLYELLIDFDNRSSALEWLGLPGSMQPNDAKAIFKEIDRMADAFDALGDLLLSESVYHITQGNYVRSAAVFAALSEGKVPREVQMINTPRTGHVLTQRMILQLKPYLGSDILPSGGLSATEMANNLHETKPEYWDNIEFSPRAYAEPSLNKWLGEILNSPKDIRCYVSYELNGSTHYEVVTVEDLDLQAIDLVYLLNNAQDGSNYDLNALVANYARKTLNLSAAVVLNLHFKERDEHFLKDGETMQDYHLTFNEVMPLVSSLYDLISKSRHTAADDYVVPGQHVPENQNLKQYNVAEIRERFDYLKEQFNQTYTNLMALFQTKGIDYNDPAAVSGSIYSATEIAGLRTYLSECFLLNITGCIPDTAIETSTEAGQGVASKAAAAILTMKNKLAKANVFMNYAAETSDNTKVEKIIEATKALLGKAFVILPHFSLRNYDEIHEVLHLDESEGIMRNADDFAMDGWLQGIAKVRKKVNKMEMASTTAAMFFMEFPEPTPVQLPCELIENNAGEMIRDYWLGLEFPEGYEPENDKLSLVILDKSKLISGSNTDMRCGLLVDEWIEIIPNREEDTGITFNYDQPDAEPPQSMLLAVTPEQTGQWNWYDLAYTLVETMDLYKARLIEPEQIDRSIFTQVLPAVMGEVDAGTRYQAGPTHPGILDLEKNNSEIQ